jgi:hypothetical protein
VSIEPEHEPEIVDAEVGRPEHRWPMALAVIGAIVLHHLALSQDYKPSPSWLYPAGAGVLLVVLLVGDPGVIDHETKPLRYATNGLIALMGITNMWAALHLVQVILEASPNSPLDNPQTVLQTGGSIWAINVIVFALWFWDVDGGGAAARARRGAWAEPAFIFPEMELEKYLDAGWYPHFVDYLVVSFYTSTAFSPSDASVIKRWAKLVMVLESAISLSLIVIVVGQAINALG